MTGYQEMLTDPSYAGQILVLTYPLVGNYGVNALDVESRRIQVRGFVVREECPLPSHWQSTGTVHDYLASQGIPGIAGVDTRALTRRLRSAGVMMGTITTDETPEEALARLRGAPSYGSIDFVRRVSTEAALRLAVARRCRATASWWWTAASSTTSCACCGRGGAPSPPCPAPPPPRTS